MKLLIFLLIMSPMVLAKKKSKDFDDERLCPDGYLYAGDDTTREQLESLNQARDYYYEEVGRSPEYSCYKLFYEKQDFLTSMHTCQMDDANLVSFEDPIEMERVAMKFQPYEPIQDTARPDYEPPIDFQFMTSGMYFDDVHLWYWTGTNRSNRIDIPVEGENQGDFSINSTPKDCLNLRMPYKNGNTPRDESFDSQVVLLATKCFSVNYFMCEARVQTVTYYTWFYANWVDLLLGFLIVILFVALCISVCAYSSNDYGRRSARRRQQMTTANHRADVPTAVIDLPPSYDSTVRIHKPVDSKPEQNQTQQQPGRMTYYKNRGRELIGKVYVYKPKTSSTTTNENPR